MTAPEPPVTRLIQPDEADLFDYALLRDYARYVRHSITRHRALFFGVLIFTVLLAVGLARALPKTFHTETRLMAQRNQVIAALGNPGRSLPGDFDAPTRGAYDLVMRRDNLVSLVKQTNLIESWQATRAPLQQVKDWVFGLMMPPMTEDLWIDSLVGTLEKRLYVNSEEGSVSIGIDWPDATMAYRLVEAAQQNFLEARHVQELSTINEAISILESRATALQEEVQEAFTEMEKVRSARRTAAVANVPRPAPDPTPKPGLRQNEAEVNQLRFLIDAKKRAITDLEDFRNRRLTELQGQLAEQRVIYSAQHPTLVDTEQRIAALTKESPQIVALKRDEESLAQQLAAMIGKQPGESEVRPRRGVSAMDLLSLGDRNEDPVVQFAQDKLRIANAKYQDMLLRIDSARLELEASRAAFKYRYSVTRPAQVPRTPVKPNVPVIILAGMVAAVGLGLFACVARDLTGGRIVEPWQLTRQLGVPVLAVLVKGEA